jgi:hypothetical protein
MLRVLVLIAIVQQEELEEMGLKECHYLTMCGGWITVLSTMTVILLIDVRIGCR